MRNISYFCIVKCLRHIFTLAAICFISLFSSEIKAMGYTMEQTGVYGDSIRISLLTCSPGNEVYSLYGHTAIRYTDMSRNIDVAVNYGVFSFSKPFFVLRFIFGLTDYEMGIVPFDYFCSEYRAEGRSVYQQELNLTEEDKLAIRDAIDNNYLPQNRVYRYNYFYDNCTTRARNIIFDHISGTVIYSDSTDCYPSYRSLIHASNEDFPWARFGNDILLGVRADRKTDRAEHQFLPLLLQEDFDKAGIMESDGSVRPLVRRSEYVVQCGPRMVAGGFPLRPVVCACIILFLMLAVTVAEMVLKKRFWFADAFLMTLDGLMGIILFMMLFSEHPATSTNLQVLLFNPVPLFYVVRVTKSTLKKRHEAFWKYAAAVIVLFLVGGFFQRYAEGVYVLALSLLIRCVWNIVYQNKYLSDKRND